jgi:uncharacterized protein YndB with AHSA1/START domain
MDARVNKTLKVTTPSDFEIEMTREFDAPRRLVFAAMTKPEYVKRWLGCEQNPMLACEIDLRVGGAYRFAFGGPDGHVTTLEGIYTEVASPKRLVFVERFKMPGFTSDEYQVKSTFIEHGGKTTLTTTILHSSKESRDGQLNAGIDKGVEPAYERIAELVATME